MIQIHPADSRYKADHGWLQSRFSFSFAEYHDPDNRHFGPLRVLNDDVVQPNRGFGMHPHEEMEIVSIVLKGQLKHRDSAGHTETTGFGGIQRMSAGTGIVHSEVNASDTDNVEFLQLWFYPEEKGLAPSYEATRYEPEKMRNVLLPVVAKDPKSDQVAAIHQDLTIYLSELDAGASLEFTQLPGRRIFLFVLEGDLTIHGEHRLNRRDSARIEETPHLTLSSDNGNRFMLIDLP